MYGGHSGSRGFVIYKKKKEKTRAVYGYYVQDQMMFEEGSLEAMLELKRQNEEADKCEKDGLVKAMVILLLAMIGAVAATFVLGTFLQGLAVMVFCAGSYLPMLIVYWARQQRYKTEELHQQFCRFHGCEHEVISWLTKYAGKEEATMEKLQKMPIYDAECGTAYSGYFITLATVAALLIANITTLGILKALGILFLTLIILFVNIFNPYNPYKLLQRPVVSQPTEREYALAVAVIERLTKATNQTKANKPNEVIDETTTLV